MVNKLTCIVVILLLASALISCSKSAPKCSDTITIEKVEELVRSKTEIESLPLELTVIRTNKSDEETGRQECAALAIFEGFYGSSVEVPITYSSELTDKKNEHYFQLTSFNNLNDETTISEDFILKRELINKVFPDLECIQKAVALNIAAMGEKPSDDDSTFHTILTQDCSMNYFVPSISDGIVTIWINERNTEKTLNKLNGKGLTVTPIIKNGRVIKWKLSGAIAEQLGING